jgi:hypothetical protein
MPDAARVGRRNDTGVGLHFNRLGHETRLVPRMARSNFGKNWHGVYQAGTGLARVARPLMWANELTHSAKEIR